MQKCAICKIAGVITGIGALNWGLIALGNLNLVTKLLGEGTTAAKGVYILIGLCGLLTLTGTFITYPCCKKNCKTP